MTSGIHHQVGEVMAESIRTATLQDRDRITALINRAFAVERFFKSGDRIDATQVVQMLSEGTFLLAVDEEGLAACVYVKPNGERAYIGLLSVDPAKQKSGLGRRMTQESFSTRRSLA